MKSKLDTPFSRHPLPGFVLDWQKLEPGLSDNEFHVMVRPGEKADIISFASDGAMSRRQEKIGQEEEIFTNYALFPTSDGFIFQQGHGVSRYIGEKLVDFTLLFHEGEQVSLGSPYWSQVDGPDRIWVDLLFFKDGPFPTTRRALVLLEKSLNADPKSLPRIIKEIPLPQSAAFSKYQDGRLYEGNSGSGTETTFRFLDRSLQERDTPLANGLNALAKNKKLGYFFKHSSWHPWILLDIEKPRPARGNPESKYSGLFAASFADTIRGQEVLCEGHPLFDSELDLDDNNLVVSPTHDLFLVLAPHGSDSLHLYLGVMRRDSQGWRPEAYRVRTFEAFHNSSLRFSRKGNSVVFISLDKQEKPEVVHAFISDLIADVNRRYPEAKLDLEALKAEVK